MTITLQGLLAGQSVLTGAMTVPVVTPGYLFKATRRRFLFRAPVR